MHCTALEFFGRSATAETGVGVYCVGGEKAEDSECADKMRILECPYLMTLPGEAQGSAKSSIC